MDLGDLRREYITKGITRNALDSCPFRQFEVWFTQAQQSEINDPSAFSLATASAAGQPTLRTVLLKLFDKSGFVFFTNYNSKKGQQLDENAQVAMLFPWLLLERQIKITGIAEKISVEQSAQYFASRPRGSQLGAWISEQSDPLQSRKVLEDKFAQALQDLSGKDVPMPESWGGYKVVPTSIEFWQGRENRLHDRFRYDLSEASEWGITRLEP
ncbi:MAG: pyridoxamine 5'-phosphate oxidase [Planctomycetota bacterium]|nr:pyridoxamine 5'-phosphate oxidase [Planctomycetota bacterium]MDG2310405.1 pyridoxamine 5'-phosphate oxidase [Planctomycetota bacterium]